MPQGSRASRRLSPGRAGALIALAASTVVFARGQAHAQAPEPTVPPATTSPPSTFPTSDTAPVTTEPPPSPPALTYTPPEGWTSSRAKDDLPELPPLPPRRPPRTHVFVIPGYLLSLTPGVASRSTTSSNGKTTTTDIANGHGVEISVSIWPAGSLVNFGGFMQAQRYFSFNGNHSRYAFGGQLAWTFAGFELGLAHRGADDDHQGTTMLQFGPFMSMAFMNIGGRFSVPLQSGSDAKPAHGAEASFVLSFKVPLHVM